LKGWYETEGSTANITALSMSNRGGGGASADFSSGSNMKTFGEAKQVRLDFNKVTIQKPDIQIPEPLFFPDIFVFSF
jgi:hypothetical protein